MPEAAGLVAAFGMSSTNPRRIAAIGPALARRARGTGALAALEDLLAGAGEWHWGGSGTPGGVDSVLTQRAASNGNPSEAEHSLDNGASARGSGQRFDE